MAENWASYSALVAHRSCPQAWQYGYVQHLTRALDTEVKVELEFGLWWHALRAAHSIARGRILGSLQWCPEELGTVDDGPKVPTAENPDDPYDSVIARVMEAAERWWDALTPEVHDVWAERLGDGLLERLVYVDERWRETWAADLENEEPLAVELRWRRDLPPLPQPGGQAVDPDTTLIGYVDEVFFDRRRSLVVVRDHKTSKALGTQTSADDMMESQLQIYAWGANDLITAWGRGPVKAVAYDRVRSTAPKQPKLNLSGTLSKQVSDFDLHTYVTWAAGPDGLGQPYPGLKKDGSGAGHYRADQALVESLSTPAARSVWFQRTLVPLNRNIVRAHLRAAVDTSLDISLTRARLEVSGEAARNLSGKCRWCDFVNLCRAQMVGGPEGDYDLDTLGLRKRS